MNKTLINKIQVYQNQTTKKDLKKLFFDETGAMYLSDGYSIIKFFDTKYNKKNRQCLIENIEKDTSYCNFMQKQIIKLYNDFTKNNFNIQATRSVSNGLYRFINDDLTCDDYDIIFDDKMLNRIERIISTNKEVNYFISKTNRNVVCIVGKNGCAFLLGCRTY